MDFGAYIVQKEAQANIDFCLLATGSELGLALAVAKKLSEQKKSVRVVSFPSFELFEQQDPSYKAEVLGANVKQYCSIEALISFGWHKYIGSKGLTISVEQFGLSAPKEALSKHFGFTVASIMKTLGSFVD